MGLFMANESFVTCRVNIMVEIFLLLKMEPEFLLL